MYIPFVRGEGGRRQDVIWMSDDFKTERGIIGFLYNACEIGSRLALTMTSESCRCSSTCLCLQPRRNLASRLDVQQSLLVSCSLTRHQAPHCLHGERAVLRWDDRCTQSIDSDYCQIIIHNASLRLITCSSQQHWLSEVSGHHPACFHFQACRINQHLELAPQQ